MYRKSNILQIYLGYYLINKINDKFFQIQILKLEIITYRSGINMSEAKVKKLTKQIEKLEGNIAHLEDRIEIAREKSVAGDISKAEFYKFKQELTVEARAIRGTIRRKEKARLFQERKVKEVRKEKEKKLKEKQEKRMKKLEEKEKRRKQKLKEKEEKKKKREKESNIKSKGATSSKDKGTTKKMKSKAKSKPTKKGKKSK